MGEVGVPFGGPVLGADALRMPGYRGAHRKTTVCAGWASPKIAQT